MNTELAVGQNCKVCGIRSDNVEYVWPKIREFVTEALTHSRGEVNTDDVFTCLLNQLMQLWIAYDDDNEIKACLVTQIITYPRRKFLRVVVLSGEGMEDWEHGWVFVETWARAMGCDGVEAFARRGFVRRAKAQGFREYYSMVGKDFLPLNVH